MFKLRKEENKRDFLCSFSNLRFLCGQCDNTFSLYTTLSNAQVEKYSDFLSQTP